MKDLQKSSLVWESASFRLSNECKNIVEKEGKRCYMTNESKFAFRKMWLITWITDWFWWGTFSLPTRLHRNLLCDLSSLNNDNVPSEPRSTSEYLFPWKHVMIWTCGSPLLSPRARTRYVPKAVLMVVEELKMPIQTKFHYWRKCM